MGYFYLAVAIVSEVIGTSSLKATEGFTRPVPSVITLVAFAVAFYFLSLTLRTLPIGVAYAIWSGVGIVLISAIGWVVFGQRLDPMALLGMGLILSGVAVIHLLSSSAEH